MIGLIFVVAIIGVIVWAVTQIPMPKPFQVVIYAICCIGLLIYLANFFGISLGNFPRR